MNWLLNRLKERSTWLSIFTLVGLLGMKIDPELREHIINAILAVAAVVAFMFREDVRERETQLPPIDLVGRSESESPKFHSVDDASVVTRTGSSFHRYRDPDDGPLQPPSMPPERRDENGWNG